MTGVTIRDVAKRANVGIATVSRVLNNNPSVSEATRQKVLAAVAELDYTPNYSARRLSLGKTLTIAVIVPFFTRPVFVERLRGVEQALAHSEYDLILFNVETVDRRNHCFRAVPRRERIDGLLIIALSPQDTEVDYFLQSQVPTVLIDTTHPRLNRVVIDDVLGGRLATQHLIDLGHHKIAYLSEHLDNPFNFTANVDRYQGYCQAFEAAGWPVNPTYLQEVAYGQQAARQGAKELFALADRPTAIFAASDTQAIGVLQAANEMGFNVPQDLSVVGYDDVEVTEYLSLTTIHQPLFEFGIKGVELLLETIEKPTRSPHKILLPVELVVRGTTAPL